MDGICDFIKEDVEQEILEMIGKLPQDILNRIKISKSDINVEKSDVEEEPEYDYHEKIMIIGLLARWMLWIVFLNRNYN